jgi:hypothetical protein
MIDARSPSFNLAKQQIIHGLEKLARFSNDMDTKFPTYGFNRFKGKKSNRLPLHYSCVLYRCCYNACAVGLQVHF